MTDTTQRVDAEPIDKGLKTGALGLVSSIVIGVASTAPGYSLAAGLAIVVGAVGLQSPSIMILAFVPMLFIASSYYYLNRVDPDCGTTFTWASRALGPRTGWMGGWGILVTDLVVMPSLAGIAASYSFSLFGATGSKFWVTTVGVAWIIVMTTICIIGIELSARTQVILLGAEIFVLTIFAVVALFKVYGGSAPVDSIRPALSWVNPLHIHSRGALAAAMLGALFLYWGWDTAVTVNEESKDATRTPGKAAIISTLILVAVYVIVAMAAQAFHGTAFLTDEANAADVLGALGKAVLGSGWDKLLIIAVLTSASASTQTTILPAARSFLSMGVHKAAPAKLAEVNPRLQTPAFATALFGLVAILWYVGLSLISDNVLTDSIAALGFGIAFYYAMTGFACVVYYRRQLFRSGKNFLFMGLAPLVGALILTWAFLQSLFTLSVPGAAGSWLKFIHFDFHFITQWQATGFGPPLVMGVGLLLLGIPLMLAWQLVRPEFFRRKREVAPEDGGLAPPLSGGGRPTDDSIIDLGGRDDSLIDLGGRPADVPATHPAAEPAVEPAGGS